MGIAIMALILNLFLCRIGSYMQEDNKLFMTVLGMADLLNLVQYARVGGTCLRNLWQLKGMVCSLGNIIIMPCP